MTINELKKLCEKQINNGNGNKEILLSDDDEGNGYHKLYFGFTPVDELIDPDDDEELSEWVSGYITSAICRDENIEDFIVLG